MPSRLETLKAEHPEWFGIGAGNMSRLVRFFNLPKGVPDADLS